MLSILGSRCSSIMRKKELSYDEAQPRALPCAIVDIVSYREGVEKTRGFGTLNIRSRGDM